MTPGARLAAAIEVLSDIGARRRPADTLKDWGLSHRFAGSGDRAGIAGLVYDALRRRASSAYLMGEDTPRATLLGMLVRERGLDPDAVARLADGTGYAPPPLTDAERARLAAADLAGAPPHVRWAIIRNGSIRISARVFGDERAEEGAALASRAPLDLRANTLKASRDEAARSLADLAPEPTRWSPHGLRIKLRADAKNPAVHAEFAYLKGLIEIQDEGSQLAALLAGAKPGEQVLDLCAGGGGKTLALAAIMENKGQIYATDDDKRRLAPIHDRLERSGARNVQVRTPKSVGNELADLEGKLDLVLIDAPCTGIGAWRRNPDAKWRVRPGALEVRVKEQAETLERAVPLVRPGRPHRLCHLLGAGRGKRRANPELRRPAPGFFRGKARRGGERAGRARLYVQQGGADLGRRPADDAAPDRHRRVFSSAC